MSLREAGSGGGADGPFSAISEVGVVVLQERVTDFVEVHAIVKQKPPRCREGF